MKPGTDGVLLGAWATPFQSEKVLDVGTGTGLIALMMAQRFENAEITGVDIDNEAVKESAQNFRNSPWSDRLNSMEQDFREMQFLSDYDLIVSNPPFFRNGVASPSQQRTFARHEASLPLNILLKQAYEALSPSGVLAIITPADYEEDVIYQAALMKLFPTRICKVISVEGKSPKRIMWEFSKRDEGTHQETLIIRDSKNRFTKEYIDLTKDFYLDF